MSDSCDPMDCSPLGSSVNGILQARTLEWVSISFSRGSSWWRDAHLLHFRQISHQLRFSSVAQLRPTLFNPMDCSMPGFPVFHYLPEFVQTHVCYVSEAIQSSHPLSPLSFLPSVFPNTRVFSNELALHIRWPKYWSFSFSISPSNEYSGLISFRID